MSNLAALIQYSATYAVSFLLSLYLQVILGLTPAVSGAVLLIQPLVMALLSPRAVIYPIRTAAGHCLPRPVPDGTGPLGLCRLSRYFHRPNGTLPGCHRHGSRLIRGP